MNIQKIIGLAFKADRDISIVAPRQCGKTTAVANLIANHLASTGTMLVLCHHRHAAANLLTKTYNECRCVFGNETIKTVKTVYNTTISFMDAAVEIRHSYINDCDGPYSELIVDEPDFCFNWQRYDGKYNSRLLIGTRASDHNCKTISVCYGESPWNTK